MEVVELEKKIKYVKQNHSENTNKPRKLLTYQIRKEKERMITVIEKLLYARINIREKVAVFKKELYSKYKIDREGLKTYNNDLKKFIDDHRQILSRFSPIQEIKEAIKKIKIGKAPGPDGLMAQYNNNYRKDY